MLKTTAIIPAYNEELNIGRVLQVLKKALALRIIDEIIVVDDGSEDETAKAALKFGVKVIKLRENKGKARAMFEGIKAAKGDVSLFIDGDLINLNVSHVRDLLEPVLEKDNCMTIARFTNGSLTSISHAININCSGQRASRTKVFKNIFETIKKIDKIKYGVEYVITNRLKRFSIEPIIVEWDSVSQILKEEKWGLTLGFFSRIRMYLSMGLGHLRNIFYNLSKLLDIEKTSD